MSGIRRKDKMNANPLEAQDSKNGKKNVVWRTGRKHEHSAGNGMRELQHDRVKQVSSGANCETRILCLVPVQRIADDWMPEMRGMDANLVGSSRLDDKLHERKRSASLQRSPPRDGTFPAGRVHGHASRIPRFSPYGRLQHPRRRPWRTMENGKISLLQPVVGLERLAKTQVCSLCLGEHHGSTRLDIETMHYARTVAAADGRHSRTASRKLIRD